MDSGEGKEGRHTHLTRGLGVGTVEEAEGRSVGKIVSGCVGGNGGYVAVAESVLWDEGLAEWRGDVDLEGDGAAAFDRAGLRSGSGIGS